MGLVAITVALEPTKFCVNLVHHSWPTCVPYWQRLLIDWWKVSVYRYGLTKRQVVVSLQANSRYHVSHLHVLVAVAARSVRGGLFVVSALTFLLLVGLGRVSGQVLVQVVLDLAERRTLSWVLVPAVLHQHVAAKHRQQLHGY